MLLVDVLGFADAVFIVIILIQLLGPSLFDSQNKDNRQTWWFYEY